MADEGSIPPALATEPPGPAAVSGVTPSAPVVPLRPADSLPGDSSVTSSDGITATTPSAGLASAANASVPDPASGGLSDPGLKPPQDSETATATVVAELQTTSPSAVVTACSDIIPYVRPAHGRSPWTQRAKQPLARCSPARPPKSAPPTPARPRPPPKISAHTGIGTEPKRTRGGTRGGREGGGSRRGLETLRN